MAKVAKKYAKALFDVALNINQLDVVYEDLEIISHSPSGFIKQPEAIDSSPSLTANQREGFIERVYNEVNPYVVSTLKVLVDNRHISIAESVFKSFQNSRNKHYKQDFAIIESTYESSEDKISRTVELIRKQTELSSVIVSTKINQDLVGGSRIKVGTTVMDGSARNDLIQLQRKFEKAD